MDNILKQIREFDKEKLFEPYLEDNFKEFPMYEDGLLSDDWVKQYRELTSLEKETETELLETAGIIRNNKTLKFLFFHLCRLAYDFHLLYPRDKIIKWPSLEPLLPDKSTQFLLFLGFYAAEKTIEIHKSMNINEEITRDTCSDVASRVLISKTFENGKIGISNICVNWLRNHASGSLFQFGRLQFHIVNYGRPFRIYKEIKTGKYIILAEPGYRFTEKGFFDGAGERLHKGAWYSIWREECGTITANMVNRKGRVEKTPVTINKNEYRLVINNSSPVMNTHIPRGPKINIEDWRCAISRGFDFFENFSSAFPEPKACVCHSWMFDSRLQDLLPEKSGLVTLQKRMHLYPLPTTTVNCGFYFIFGKSDIDINNAPADTTLRRKIIEHVQRGGILTGGSMIIFKDEISQSLREAPEADAFGK